MESQPQGGAQESSPPSQQSAGAKKGAPIARELIGAETGSRTQKEGVHPPQTDVTIEDVDRFQDASVTLKAVKMSRSELHSKRLDVSIADAEVAEAQTSLRRLKEEYERKLRAAERKIKNRTAALRQQQAEVDAYSQLLGTAIETLRQRVEVLFSSNLLNLLPVGFPEELRSHMAQADAARPTEELRPILQRLEDMLVAATFMLRETLCSTAEWEDEPEPEAEERPISEEETAAIKSYAYVPPEKKDKQEVHIRWMIRRDLPEILQIAVASFGEQAWREGDFLQRLRERNCIAMVAEEKYGEKVYGFMVYELREHKLHVLNMAVHPAMRHRDIGTQIVDKLISKLSRHRRTNITMDIRESNLSAQQFLRSQGFKATKIEKGLYPEMDEDAYEMRYVLADADEISEETRKVGEGSSDDR